MQTVEANVRHSLEIGGVSTDKLVEEYGTPLMVYDEGMIRRNARAFRSAFESSELDFQVAYASKAFLCKEMARLANEEALSLDVVSGGELYTALEAGFPAARIHFHGNNKSEEELAMALDAEIGCFVVDNFLELEMLHDLASKRNQEVSILLRVTPGVEAHTHEYIMTGQEDSKFGFGLSNGQAETAIQIAARKPQYKLLGIHSHIGSQMFGTEGFDQAIQILTGFVYQMNKKYGLALPVLNVGGGFGVRYTEDDQPLTISEYVTAISESVKKHYTTHELPYPEVWIEPGRSMVAEAGTTLYKVGSKKIIPDLRTYITVDGGMTDNIRPALYQARYQAMLANRPDEDSTELVSVAGKCCESGDMLIWDLMLPPTNYGDILAVFSTGAYGYSMASNYNRIPRPAVVFADKGESRVVIERETYEDLVRKDQ
ncbi:MULTISPECIES: diaminopimelate decarboxylase [Pontibacillus]|uniref:Diaminopimelate decarboxylase n=1 Tax=Pontibacillus chungwhensis TaxID=265426 RepID=A0ABY8V137_9BACI|nr:MULTISPECIES: diaminopimelate decarboxylase [Pontibacillus]MCD5324556.1 diaminopimelate decarboxylase [Pontibacillus sp. HN14]WIF99148.1 diaminopimelate decarboxylase [Pontibacillus chungwhensis]